MHIGSTVDADEGDCRQMAKPRMFTVDNETAASNPGGIRINPLVWFKHDWQFILELSGLLLASLLLAFGFNLFFGVFVIPCAYFNLIYWIGKKEHFAFGAANAGMVISTDPLLVAVSSDLSKWDGEYFPVIQIIPFQTNVSVSLGTMVPTVALYQDSSDEIGHWAGFDPVPVEYVTHSKEQFQRSLDSFDESDWDDLHTGVCQLMRPYEPGLFHVHTEKSDWDSDCS